MILKFLIANTQFNREYSSCLKLVESPPVRVCIKWTVDVFRRTKQIILISSRVGYEINLEVCPWPPACNFSYPTSRWSVCFGGFHPFRDFVAGASVTWGDFWKLSLSSKIERLQKNVCFKDFKYFLQTSIFYQDCIQSR